ncbi:methyl-accepting chemotaxis protein [Bacillus fonticola]|uniref:methyl-accepting chemotaxis protein n=1 Tax=Bacillus fonticola TaxID=2728853 RepID=UPI003898E447
MVERIRYLVDSVQRSSNSVNDSVENLSAVAEETIASSEEVSRAIAEVASGATQQASDAETTHQRVTDLSKQIENIYRQASKMQAISNEAKTANDEGVSRIQVLRSKTTESNDILQTVEAAILNLGAKIAEIDQVMNSINDISEQTNLLALNASIEAARAGENGRGFAVVANEVRKLAEQSSQATERVRLTITGIEMESERTINEMLRTKDITKDQNRSVEDAEQAFGKLADYMNDMVTSIGTIGQDVDQMKAYKDEVVEAIQSISNVAGQAAASSEEVSASTDEQLKVLMTIGESAESLQEASAQLQLMMKQFRIKEDSESTAVEEQE